MIYIALLILNISFWLCVYIYIEPAKNRAGQQPTAALMMGTAHLCTVGTYSGHNIKAQ